MAVKILVYLETREGSVRRSSLETVAAGLEVAGNLGGEVVGGLVGDGVAGLAPPVGAHGVGQVFHDPKVAVDVVPLDLMGGSRRAP